MIFAFVWVFGLCNLVGASYAHAANVSNNACNIITSHYQQWRKDKSTDGLVVDPDLGYNCLKSVTINNTLANNYLSELIKYTQFQSTLTSLKYPPKDYYWPAVDLVGELEDIQKNITAGAYHSQYDVDIDVAKVWSSAHDGHFHTATCTSAAITFQRTVYLISVSSDGLKDPLVYVYDDLAGLQSGKKVSNIITINGEDAITLLKSEAFYNLADPDSAWNYMFWNTARDPKTIPLSATFTFPNAVFNWYPGKETILGFANGTSRTYETQAVIDTTTWDEDITDGEAFFHHYCLAPASTAAASSTATDQSSAASTTTSPAIPSVTRIFEHPEAVLQDPFDVVAGYYLDDAGYEDVAVLWVAQFLSFFSQSPAQLDTIRNVTRDFLADAVSAGKTRLVVDVSGNLGGVSGSPFEVFDRLFPKARTVFHTNYELSKPVKLVTDSFGAIPVEDLLPKANDSQADQQLKSEAYYNDYNYHTCEDVNGNNFSSLAEFAPPVQEAGANFTATFQLPLNNTIWDLTQNYIPFGYGPYYNASYQQPFEEANVVVLSDGTCASACAVFLHLLGQLNIKTIAIGGLPGSQPMQAIGGTKGDQAASAEIVQHGVQMLIQLGAIADVETAKQLLPGFVPLPLGDIKGTVFREYGINTRNHLLPNDTIPSMMRFEPAGCHIYYTPENVADVQRMWRDAVDIAWNGKACAAGGFPTNASGSGSGPKSPSHVTSDARMEKAIDVLATLALIVGGILVHNM
ncbi:uncharacterized protein TrAFT101_005382 [Trichoderma asperellum]|uniref:uncharacterized protein n=1 Tax=Trichoderma asperellum TaxID=101201 RepID=UPI0033239BC6|nr:hypothetical protein TrAFT101_005382 [Trichoderma asperellum]